MLISVFRTYPLPRRALLPIESALFALTRQAKDLRNSTIYAIRQVLCAHDGGALKADLQPLQQDVLALANACVERINARREPERHLPAFGTSAAKPFKVLDVTLLDNLVRELPDASGTAAYRRLPSVVAQQIGRDVAGDFKTWLKALKAHALAPGAFTGRPKMPGYLDRHARTTVSFPWQSLSGRFTSIRDKELFLDYGRTEPLPDADKDALWAFGLKAAVEALARKHALPVEARPVEVRLVPQRGRTTKVEVVFELPVEIDARSAHVPTSAGTWATSSRARRVTRRCSRASPASGPRGCGTSLAATSG